MEQPTEPGGEDKPDRTATNDPNPKRGLSRRSFGKAAVAIGESAALSACLDWSDGGTDWRPRAVCEECSKYEELFSDARNTLASRRWHPASITDGIFPRLFHIDCSQIASDHRPR